MNFFLLLICNFYYKNIYIYIIRILIMFFFFLFTIDNSFPFPNYEKS